MNVGERRPWREERDQQMMIAAAAAAAAAAVGRGEEGSCIMQCDADVITPAGIARGRLIVTTRAVTFQCHAGVGGAAAGNNTDDDGVSAFTPADDDPHQVGVVDPVQSHSFHSPLDQ